MNAIPVISRLPINNAAAQVSRTANAGAAEQAGGAASADPAGLSTNGKDFAAALNDAASKPFSCPMSARTSTPVLASQIFADLSQLAVTIRDPSGL